MTEKTPVLESSLTTRFPEAVKTDERGGYEGYLIETDNLLEVVTALRDEMGYDFLSSLTAVDYIDDGVFEVVYHLFKSTGGGALVLSTQVPRAEPVVPSLIDIYPGADFQEREAYDLMGIKFEGHPDLRRILMWEGFSGHPLRKDWHEPYYEQDSKPFDARWPEGQVRRSEDLKPVGGISRKNNCCCNIVRLLRF